MAFVAPYELDAASIGCARFETSMRWLPSPHRAMASIALAFALIGMNPPRLMNSTFGSVMRDERSVEHDERMKRLALDQMIYRGFNGFPGFPFVRIKLLQLRISDCAGLIFRPHKGRATPSQRGASSL